LYAFRCESGKKKKDDGSASRSSFFANMAGGKIAPSARCPEHLSETYRVEGLFNWFLGKPLCSLYFYTKKGDLSILPALISLYNLSAYREVSVC